MITNYEELLRTPQWKIKREKILRRDNYKCRCCGSSLYLQVHHRQYHSCRSTGEKKAPWVYEDRYLVTLCSSCHKRGHQTYQIPNFSL